MLQDLQERFVKASALIILRRRREFVLEAELIQKRAQPRIVVFAEARMRAEGIGNLRQRLAEIFRKQLLVRHVVRNLTQAVHVVGESEQLGLDLVVGQHAKRMAYHRGACDLAEGADVRQARGSIAGLE